MLIGPIQIFQPFHLPLLGVYPEVMEEGVRPAIAEIAADMNLEYVSLQNLFTDSSLMLDGLHPQATGARMLAETLYKACFAQ